MKQFDADIKLVMNGFRVEVDCSITNSNGDYTDYKSLSFNCDTLEECFKIISTQYKHLNGDV